MIDIREEAYKVILKVLKKFHFSDNLLANSGKKIRKQNGDHNLFYTLVKGVIKMYAHLDYIAGLHGDKEKLDKTDLKYKVILYIGLYQIKYLESIPDHAAVHETVALAKKKFGEGISGWVNAVLRSYLRNPKITYPEDPVRRMALEYSFPEELITVFIDYWGEEEAEMLCMYFNDVPRLNIRINQLATTTDKCRNYFANKNIILEASEASKQMLTTNRFAQQVI
ncbi:MAG: 16S rRNA (cytosine(967)-C(5))-methyltransferase RsmB, partial [Candidatus Cloacimonetes bacterium]|nr:16S rRNA (cytosine(967)-C(5))-methyltransferase RsmB [Candidatus Cloacimonadota bacterium]